jgi:hypothetical protein
MCWVGRLNHLFQYTPMKNLYDLNDDWMLQIFNWFSEKDSISFGLSSRRILKLFYAHYYKIFTELFATKNIFFESDIEIFYRLAKRIFHSHLPMVNLALFTYSNYYTRNQMIILCEGENILDVSRKQMYVDYYDQCVKQNNDRPGVICNYCIKWIFLLYDHTFPEIDNLTRQICNTYDPRAYQNILSALPDDYVHLVAIYNSFARILDSLHPGTIDELLDVLIMAHEKSIVIENIGSLLRNLTNRSGYTHFTKSYVRVIVSKLVRIHHLLGLELIDEIWRVKRNVTN